MKSKSAEILAGRTSRPFVIFLKLGGPKWEFGVFISASFCLVHRRRVMKAGKARDRRQTGFYVNIQDNRLRGKMTGKRKVSGYGGKRARPLIALWRLSYGKIQEMVRACSSAIAR